MDSFKGDVCDKMFTTRSSLFKHGRSVHEKTSFVCSLCDKSFSRKDAIKRHKKAVHERILGLQCEVCFAKFTKKTDLTKHKSFCCRCHKCKVQFSSISEFCKHPCPGKEMNEPVPKRSKNDAAMIVDDVPTNSSNQATGSGKRDLKPPQKKNCTKTKQKSWKQIEVSKTEKLKEKNSEVYNFFMEALVQYSNLFKKKINARCLKLLLQQKLANTYSYYLGANFAKPTHPIQNQLQLWIFTEKYTN